MFFCCKNCKEKNKKNDTEMQKNSCNVSNISKIITSLKTIAAIMVVYVHSYSVFGSVGSSWADLPFIEIVFLKCLRLIFDMSVPIFYIISAYLLFRKPYTWKDNIRKKIRSLAVPYIIWNLFWFLIYNIKSIITGDLVLTFSTGVNSILGIPFGPGSTYCAQTWFIRDLFLMNLMSPLFAVIFRKFPVCGFISIVALWFSPLDSHLRRSIVFFSLGCLLTLQPSIIEYIKSVSRKKIYGIAVVILICGVNPIDILQRLVPFGLLLIGINYFADHEVWPKLYTNCSKLYPHTFIIYVAHFQILTFLQNNLKSIIIPRFGGRIIVDICLFLFIPWVVIWLCTLFSKCFQHYLPKLYRICTGGR